MRGRGGRGRGEEGHTPWRGESRTKKKRCRRSAGEAESHEPPSRPHRRRVSYPIARAHREEKKKEENVCSAPDREPDFFSIDESAVPSTANRKGQPERPIMVYESDFYTTRRPYSRPLVSSYSVSVSILKLCCFLFFFFFFLCTTRERAGWKYVLIMFLLHPLAN